MKKDPLKEVMDNIDWNRIILTVIPVLQPILIFGGWLAFSRWDKRADIVSKFIAIAEPIPTIDLNLPKPVVLASLYHSIDEALDVLEDVIKFMKDLDIPTTEEIVEKVKEEIVEEILPDPITKEEGKEIVSDFYACKQSYKDLTPKLLRNKWAEGIFINGCLIKKGWGDNAIKQAIRDLFT
jgi:hypothetical protein|tara:strand:- start:725 stop:1267 length:543 start_codon:yes stop_codon:yes gene_type:complete